VPRDYFSANRKAVAEVTASHDYGLHDLVNIAHSVMAQPRFLMACSTLANEIAQKFSCARVNLGWKKRGYVRLVSVSHLGEFKSDSAAAQQLESLFEEVVDQDTIITIPPEHQYFVVDRAHRDFVAGNVLNQIISLPLYRDDKIAGVLTCEIKEEKLPARQIESLSLLLEIVSPWLAELSYRDKWFGARLLHRLGNMSANWFKGEKLALKISLVTAGLLIALSLLIKLDYRVEGVATLQTDLVRFVSAPFDGVIKDVFVREGAQVHAGDRLVSLDSKELQLKHSQEAADIVRFIREADKSRAQDALADMKIAQSRVDELTSELKRTAYNLERATMTAQSDGIVVEGDTKKLLGAPVSKGDVLMKIALVENMYALIKIRERDIDEVRPGLLGELVLVSQPENIFSIKIEKMIPLAEIDQHEGNVFVMKALFNGQPKSWWRPGMSGVARIDAGKRTIAWMMTHRIIDFIRMYIWW
jgi:multidrug efflux pump subunit AcrA (membrane-fusion protein)